ncbi:MAG: toxic anion resistance protein [Lachnospiraceae bacterium]|nr:toxic anion resistance protein [Lachnospiraceae bacterium]MBQ2407345.1 toxic anion resistance protein [Lachnospiraceae bacterium]MBQ5851253.1 toxic anion resistance protein [Lachnospiraceae bacterium]
MGLDFKKPEAMAASMPQTVVDVEQKNEVAVVEEYSIVDDRKQMTETLVGSQEVDNIASQIEVYNLETIVTFGGEVAENISKASDVVLNSMNMSQINDSGELLKTLAKIMDQFDIDEIKENPGMFNKLFGKLTKQIEKILDKYHTMGQEVDKIYVELKKYESEIKESNRKLETLFEANVGYYHELVKYILAGEQGCRELEAYISQREQDMQATGDNSIQFELQSLQQALSMLEQRTQDLRTAESVAMQSIPMIKTMEFSNMNLVRKINSAFIITLPVFKQALAQAIMLKRQRVQAEALSALDEKTNEMLIKNARNTVEQSKMTAQLASGSSIKIETLETTWRTIVTGIEETRRIQQDAHQKRIEDQARLENIKAEFNRLYHMPNPDSIRK